MGRLLPDTGFRPRCSTSWTTTCGGSPTSGPRSATQNKPTSWVVHPVLRHVQQGQAGPVGVRRPPQRRLHAQVLLDQHRPTPDRHGEGRHPTTPRLSSTGPDDGAKHPCRSTTPPCGCSKPRTVAARSAGHADRSPRPATNPREWETVADDHPRHDHTIVKPETGTPDEAEPRLIHADCRNGRRRHFTRLRAIRACLSRMRGNRHVLVLRGARRRMCRAYPGAPSMTSSSGVRVPCGG